MPIAVDAQTHEELKRHLELVEDDAERLTAENVRLREALIGIIRFAEANGMQDWKMTKTARKALGHG